VLAIERRLISVEALKTALTSARAVSGQNCDVGDGATGVDPSLHRSAVDQKTPRVELYDAGAAVIMSENHTQRRREAAPAGWSWDDGELLLPVVKAFQSEIDRGVPVDLTDQVRDLRQNPGKLFVIERDRAAAVGADHILMRFYPSEELLMTLAALRAVHSDEH
jgi:hypothetical protein